MKYGGFWLRFVAAILDGIILMLVGVVFGFVVGFILGFALAAAGQTTQTIQIVCGAAGYVIGIVLNWLYFTTMESSKGQATLGKKALGLKVTDESGKRISFARANGRYWSKIISALILLVGYMMAGWTEKKQALHDKLAATLVVKAN